MIAEIARVTCPIEFRTVLSCPVPLFKPEVWLCDENDVDGELTDSCDPHAKSGLH